MNHYRNLKVSMDLQAEVTKLKDIALTHLMIKMVLNQFLILIIGTIRMGNGRMVACQEV